jgi:hypothetical protein
MKHVVIIDCDLGGKGQTAGLANQHIFADFPMGTVFALAN